MKFIKRWKLDQKTTQDLIRLPIIKNKMVKIISFLAESQIYKVHR